MFIWKTVILIGVLSLRLMYNWNGQYAVKLFILDLLACTIIDTLMERMIFRDAIKKSCRKEVDSLNIFLWSMVNFTVHIKLYLYFKS